MPENRKPDESSKRGPSSDAKDLKEREYRDKEGNVHHHTHTSKEQREPKERKAS